MCWRVSDITGQIICSLWQCTLYFKGCYFLLLKIHVSQLYHSCKMTARVLLTWGFIPILLRKEYRNQHAGNSIKWPSASLSQGPIKLSLTITSKASSIRSKSAASFFLGRRCAFTLAGERPVYVGVVLPLFPCHYKKLSQHGIDFLHLLIFPCIFVWSSWWYFVNATFILWNWWMSLLDLPSISSSGIITFQPFSRMKSKSQATWSVVLLSTWKYLLPSYHIIMFLTSEPCSIWNTTLSFLSGCCVYLLFFLQVDLSVAPIYHIFPF